jgi:hypothetical protein
VTSRITDALTVHWKLPSPASFFNRWITKGLEIQQMTKKKKKKIHHSSHIRLIRRVGKEGWVHHWNYLRLQVTVLKSDLLRIQATRRFEYMSYIRAACNS